MSLDESFRFAKASFKATGLMATLLWSWNYSITSLELQALDFFKGPEHAIQVAESSLNFGEEGLVRDLVYLGWDAASRDYLESQGIYKGR